MGDADILDLLFDSGSGIIGEQTTSSDRQQSNNMLFTDDQLKKPAGLMTDFDTTDWSSSVLDLDGLDNHDFLNSLMDTNLPDDVKQQQQQMTPAAMKQVNDHAYSISPASPHSDSGISNGPYSPSNSSTGIDDMGFDLERELFAPLDLKSYETEDQGNSPSLLDAMSESSSPGLYGNESPVSFDFEDLLSQSSADPVKGITISTDESTKVIKVLSVNGNRQTSLLTTLNTKQQTPTVPSSHHAELVLADEEKDLLRKEGIQLPSHLPLTREEEKILRSVRRRIRNKASARNSRRKKQDYMEALEKRVKICTDEKRHLEKKVSSLEKQNSTLVGQLKKLQKLVTEGTRQTARTGTCAMILALSFALVLLPNYQSFLGANDTSLSSSEAGGRQTRNLLSKPEDFINPAPQQEKSFNYIPFLNFDRMAAQMSQKPRQPVDEPVDGQVEKSYIHDPLDGLDEGVEIDIGSPFIGELDEKVIHMEITQLPEDAAVQDTKQPIKENLTRENYIQTEAFNRGRNIRMDLEDEL